MTTTNRPLGRAQEGVLRMLRERNSGTWSPGCGWYWDTHSGTRRILDSLVRRGLVTKTGAYTYRLTERNPR